MRQSQTKIKLALVAVCIGLLCAGFFGLRALEALAAVADIYFGAPQSPMGVTMWQVMDTSADASTAVELVPGPTAQRLNVTRVIISCGSAITVDLQDEDATIVAGPYYFTTGGPGTIDLTFPYPRKLNGLKGLYFNASGAGAITVEVEGFTSG
jgi:hypothetical protein